ncbi:hypothetical protein [Devosia chinhatensis]|nr:hypothetical protein [Devosia chinhatensis]
MTAKTEQKPVSDEKPHNAPDVPAEAEIADEKLDRVVGGIARRGPRMS